MKRTLPLLLSLLVLCCACAAPAAPEQAEQTAAPTQAETPADPEREAQADPAEALPESCRAWYHAAETCGDSDKFASAPFPQAKNATAGVGRSYGVHLPGGETTDLIVGPFDEGITLEEFSSGGARTELATGQLTWNGESYSAYTITGENCVLPNLWPNDGHGILRLNIHGDCTIDGGGAEQGCFEGFDCVLLCGDGTLTLQNTSGIACGGGSTFPLPALIVDGTVTVRCGSVVLQPNAGESLCFAQLGGTLSTGLLSVSGGDLLLAGGTLLSRRADETARAIFRSGTALLDDWSCPDSTMILSGGNAYLASALPSGTVVESGAGTLASADLSGAAVHHGGAILLESETDGNPYYQTVYDDSWITAKKRKGIRWDSYPVASVEDSFYFAGTLFLEEAAAQSILPWGALHLDLTGESGITEELGGTSMLLTGKGSLTAPSLNLWGWGGVHRPVLALREQAHLTVNSLGVGSNAEEEGLLLLEKGAALDCTDSLWLQNAALTVRGGELHIGGNCSIDKGRVEISGGTVVLSQGLWLGEGDIVVSGGEVIVPGGEEGLCVENGQLIHTGGTIREPAAEE